MKSKCLNSIVCEGAFYRHYKGGLYMVNFVGIHSETMEKLVVYQNDIGEHWIRPRDMFLESVLVEGVEVPRFELQVPSREEGC